MRKNDLKQDCKMTWDQINQKYPEDRSEMDKKENWNLSRIVLNATNKRGLQKNSGVHLETTKNGSVKVLK